MQEFIRVPESNIEGLEAAFEKLARKAAKLGLDAPKLVKGDSVDVMFHKRPCDDHWSECKNGCVVPPDHDIRFHRFVMVSCEGSAPVLDGWELICVIDHTTDPEIGNLIRTVPGKEAPVEYRHSDPICQHCNSMRRRHETFLLLKDGEYKQVGRNCLADFCRDPEMASGLVQSASMLYEAQSLISAAGDDDRCGSSGPAYYPIEHVLAMSRCLIRQLGWVSRAQSEAEMTPSTSGMVSSVIGNPTWKQYATRDFIAAVENLSDDDREMAAKSLAWIRSKKDSGDDLNDYIYNLLVVCSQERIPNKHFGLACSLISAYMRDQEQEIERKLRANRPPSQHFGTVKKREKFTLTVVGMHYWEGDYGVTTLVRFVDQNGNIAVWKASGEKDDLEQDKTYLVTGTVKEHSDYKGTLQTVLSRCKYAEVEELESETVQETAHA